jgi:hypothetical protein
MSAAGWFTMILSLSLVWSATVWSYWMVLSRPRAEEAADAVPSEVDPSGHGRASPQR